MVVSVWCCFQDSKMLSLPECELINQCLLLVRNLLHVSSIPTPSHHAPSYPGSASTAANGSAAVASNLPVNNGQQAAGNSSVLTEDQIMWNLFAQRFDNIIIQLLTCKQQVRRTGLASSRCGCKGKGRGRNDNGIIEVISI